MPQFFLNKKLIFLLISIIILVALIGFSMREKENVSWPEQFVRDSVGFVQQIFHTPTQYVVGFLEDIKDLQNTYEENEKLKARLDEYLNLQTEVERLKDENEKLRENLDVQDDYSKYSPIQATVIGRNPDRWDEMIIINKGKLQGVEKNMAVITPQGLIGKVKYATQFSATVQLMSTTDPQNRISAVIQGKEGKVYGLIEGYDSKKKMLLMKKIDFDVDVEVGANIITSGLGKVFPSGLPIGTVEEVEVDEYGLTQTAYVKPAADFYDLTQVMVVETDADKDLLTEGLEDADDEEAGL